MPMPWSSALSRAAKRTGCHLLVVTLTLTGMALGAPAIANASDGVPTEDLAIVSKVADVTRAHPGQLVTYTIVAINNGPDTALSLDVADLVDFQDSGFQFVEESCDFGISPDTPFCEYSNIAPGETVTTVVTLRVLRHSKLKVATNTACVMAEDVVIDPVPSNDCVTVTLPLTGSKKH
jgi:uncharacterized repeat protein (TIGR01451 family)